MSSFKMLLAGLALMGFALSLTVHLFSCFGVNVSRFVPSVWLLHLGIFVIFVPLLIYTRAGSGNEKEEEGRDYYWWHFFSPLPRWLRYVSYGLLIYVGLNFVLFGILGRKGSAEEVDGKYVLHNRENGGESTREISEEEYDLRRAEVLRGFSGHWLVFYLLPALYFLYYGNRSRNAGLKDSY